MDLEELKACLRGLLSSTAYSYNLNSLLNDFKNLTGLDMPLFGYNHPVQFLKTLDDTVQLFGNPYNPEVALVESNKSAHITSLVDRQRTNTAKSKGFHFVTKPKRLIVPNRSFVDRGNEWLLSHPPQFNNYKGIAASQLQQLQNCSMYLPDNINVILPQLQTNSNYNNSSNMILKPQNVMNSTQLPVETFCYTTNNYSALHNEKFVVSKKKSSYFDDISDSESCLSIEDIRSSYSMSKSCFVNDGIKSKLEKLIKNYPKGLWCCELPELFQKEYNFALDYREYGYTSLIQMLSELPDVFRCVRPGNEDWLLFDASVAPSPEEKKIMRATTEISCEVATNIKKLLCSFFENSPDSRIDLDKILQLYKNTFGSCLDFQSFGFKDLKTFLKTWEGSLFSFLDCGEKTFVVPALKITVQPSLRWEEALPPITAENDIFVEIFPKDVVGPEESLLELDLARHVAVGNVVKVSVAEVWSPSCFYIQLNKFRSRLNLFMDDLQKFYNVHLSKYKMPDSTIRPKQVCVGLYTSDPDLPDEWHRAQIIKVINEKTVFVNFIDYGTETRIKKTHLRFLHRSFQSFPVQGFLAQLYGVVPLNGEEKWPVSTSKRFLDLVRVPCLDAEIVDIDFKKPCMSVVLHHEYQKSSMSLNKKLIQEKLACWKQPVLCHLVKDEPETRQDGSRLSENQTSSLSDMDSHVSVGEQLKTKSSETTKEFSDIADLGQPTLFHFKMKSLKNESTLPQKRKIETNQTLQNMKFEFDEVPDLHEVETEIRGIKEKEMQKGMTSNEVLEKNTSSQSSSSSLCEGLRTPSPQLPAPSLREKLPSPQVSNAVGAFSSQLPVSFSSPAEKLQTSPQLSPLSSVEKFHPVCASLPAKPRTPSPQLSSVSISSFPEEKLISSVSNAVDSSPQLSSPSEKPQTLCSQLSCPSEKSQTSSPERPLSVSSTSSETSQTPSREVSNAVCPPPEESSSQSVQTNSNIAPEIQFSSFFSSGKPKRLPPGFENANALQSFEESQFLQSADDVRKKINILAMEFLTRNASIKQVGVNDPTLALKIATEMAEACFASRYGQVLSAGLNQNSTKVTESQSDVSEVEKRDETPLSSCTEDPTSPQCSPKKKEIANVYIREKKIKCKTLHLVSINQELYFCAEQIVHSFTVLSCREIADRILRIKRILIDYRIITKATDEEVLKVIKRSQLPIVKKKLKKLKIYLLPIANVIPFLQGLSCNTESYENEFLKLQSMGDQDTESEEEK